MHFHFFQFFIDYYEIKKSFIVHRLLLQFRVYLTDKRAKRTPNNNNKCANNVKL